MKKALLALVVLLPFLVLTPPTQASAQGVYIGAGLNFPTSDYSDEHDAGFLGVGGVSFDLPMEGLSVYGEGFWGRNSFSHDDYGDGAVTNPYGVMGGLLYDFAEEDSPGFYAFGQAGLMVHKFSSDEFEDESDSGFGYGGGVGFGFPMDGVGFWVEGRYMGASIDDSTTAFFGLMAGISMSLGGE
jgi:hypothetical protein